MNILKIVRTAKDRDERFQRIDEVKKGITHKSNNILTVDSEITFQTIIGFGGAFTEATAFTLSRISKDLRSEVIDKYFDPEEGLGYTMGRVHIHSCDFALGNYSYVEDDNRDLKSFSIEHDRDLILPLIKDSMKKAGLELKLLASPWSPPAWMKTNGKMNEGGKLKEDCRGTWAQYYIKFIDAYRKEGVNIWGITVQNEPDAVQTWDSCIYSGEEERDFIKNHLGPKLHNSGMKDIKLLIWDHNRDLMVERSRTVLEDPEAAKYVWGTGFHWYVSEEFGNVGKVHDLFPDKHLLFTEGCQEGGCRIGEWFTGERYARNMIGDFNNWCEGYLDWNLVLDETGGPNHVQNLCDAPIIADTKQNRLFYNSSYYYIGHFSRYIKPGALRVFSVSETEYLSCAAFLNKDRSIVIVVMNDGDDGKEANIEVDGDILNGEFPAHSISTYIVSH